MRIMFELAATVIDSILAIWFVTKFCKLKFKWRDAIISVFLPESPNTKTAAHP